MCPRPGTRLNITATASLALPSAVCVAPRTQSHWSQRSASFGRRCPQYGHGILSPVVGFGGATGASVYSTFILNESPKPRGIRQANRIGQPRIYADYTDVLTLQHGQTSHAVLWSVKLCRSHAPFTECGGGPPLWISPKMQNVALIDRSPQREEPACSFQFAH